MNRIEKEKLIKADIASIENRVRHAFNQGYDLGFKDGKKRAKPLDQELCDDWYDVPSDEMTLKQARQAVKDLRKKLAKYLEQEPTIKNDCAEQNGCITCSLDDGDDCCRKLYEESMQESTPENDLPHCQHTDEEIAKSFIEDVEAVKDQLPCGEQMDFPSTFDEFVKDYGFKDKDEIYTNGSELIPVFRVKQWLEHISTTKNDLGVDCISRQAVLDLIADYNLSMGQVVRGIHALPSVTLHEPRWIPVSEKLPKAEYGESDSVLVCFENGTQDVLYFDGSNWRYPTGESYISVNHKNGWHNKVIAWMPLPKAYEPQESEDKE